MDVLSASHVDDRLDWYENDGSQNFTTHTISTAANGPWSVVAADVDGDGDTDVLSASRDDDKIAWYKNDGAQNFTPHTITTTANDAVSVFAADVDGDGDTDVLSASSLDDKIAWYKNNGAENFTAHTISTAANGAFGVFAADVDGDGDLDVLSASFLDDKIAWYQNAATSVTGRHLFYNRSAFDGSNASINVSDDTAIAPDKSAYLPGAGLAGFQSVSSYSRGINGIMVDLVGGGNHAAISLGSNDFFFKVGNNNTPVSWTPAPTPSAISVRTNFDGSGTDRVVITWADGAIKNLWLEAIVFPTSRTGLTAADIFFWGNKIGDIGSPTATAFTTTAATDAAPIVAGGLGPAGGITNPRDIDRSNTITAAGDRAAATANIGAIARINIGTGGPFGPDSEGGSGTTLDDGVSSGLAARLSASSSEVVRPLPVNVRIRQGSAGAAKADVNRPGQSLDATWLDIADLYEADLGLDDDLLESLVADLALS